MNITITGTLQRFTNYQRNHFMDVETVGQGLEQLTQNFPDLRKIIFDTDGSVRPIHRLFLNDEQIDETGLANRVGEKDKLDIITAIAGG